MNRLCLLLILLFSIYNSYGQSSSVFDASYFNNDNFEPPLRPGKGFNITDVYKSTKSCFTLETSSPSKLVNYEGSEKILIKTYYTRNELEYNIFTNLGYSGKVSYLNLFALSGAKLTELTTKNEQKIERLIFVANIDLGKFEFETDPILLPDAQKLIDNKKYNEFIDLYGTHYISGIKKEVSIKVIITHFSDANQITKTDKNEINAGANIPTYGSASFEVKDKTTKEKFLKSSSSEVVIDIKGLELNENDIKKDIGIIIAGNKSVDEKMIGIESTLSNAFKNKKRQGVISQYYFTPFTLYGVENIIWNKKKENQLIKINENVLKVYKMKTDMDEFLKTDWLTYILDGVEKKYPGFSDKYKTDIMNTYNSLVPTIKEQKLIVENILKSLEKEYNKCSAINCNPDLNCCILSDVDSKIAQVDKKSDPVLEKLLQVIKNDITSYIEEESKPDCEKNNTGLLTIVNKSANPYDVYKNGQHIGQIAGNQAATIAVEMGTTIFKAEQVSGWLIYPTVNNRKVVFNQACQKLTMTIGYED